MQAEFTFNSLRTDIECFYEEWDLRWFSCQSRFVYLNPFRASIDKRLEVRSNDLLSYVENEFSFRFELEFP